jgi:hypothetical protein
MGWAPTAVTQYSAGTRTQNSRQAPRVDHVFGLGKALTVESAPRARSARHLARGSRIHQTCETSERSRKRGVRANEAARNGGTRQYGKGERTSHGTWRPDRHGGASANRINIAQRARDVGAGLRTARPSPSCDEGLKGPLTKPRADGSRRTTLGVNNGIERAAHLDLLPLSIVDRLVDQLCHSRVVLTSKSRPTCFRSVEPPCVHVSESGAPAQMQPTLRRPGQPRPMSTQPAGRHAQRATPR